MNKLFYALAATLLTFALHAQKKASVKIKAEGFKIKYDNLPELTGFDNHKNFSVSARDINDLVYTVIAPGKTGQIDLKLGYLDRLVQSTGIGSFNIEIHRVIHKALDKNEKTSVQEVKNADGTTKKLTYYNYELTFEDEYQVIIYDHLNGDAVVADTIISVNSSTLWPANYLSGKSGLGSSRELENYYESQTAPEVKSKFDDAEKLKSFQAGVDADVKVLLNSLIATELKIYTFFLSKTKTKDERFLLLDSAFIYMEQGLDAIKDKRSENIFLNCHSKEAFINFDHSYRIFAEYSKPEYLEMIADAETAEEYEYVMRVSLFVSSLFSSRYEEAVRIAEQTSEDRDKVESSKQGESTDNGTLSSAFSELKRSDAQKALDLMELFMPILKREVLLYDKHKDYYHFYK